MPLHQQYWSHHLVPSALLSGMTEKVPQNLNLICRCCVLTMMLSCSAALAHIILRERLHIFGILGCILCVVGSTTIVLHAPAEREIESVIEVWNLATEPGTSLPLILLYSSFLALKYHFLMVKLQVTELSGFCFPSVSSFSLICSSGHNSCIYPYIPLYPTIWPYTHYGVYRSLFPCRFFVGM